MAFALFEFGVMLYRQRLRRDHPEMSESDIDRVIAEWMERRPGAELGDMVGVPSARVT